MRPEPFTEGADDGDALHDPRGFDVIEPLDDKIALRGPVFVEDIGVGFPDGPARFGVQQFTRQRRLADLWASGDADFHVNMATIKQPMAAARPRPQANFSRRLTS